MLPRKRKPFLNHKVVKVRKDHLCGYCHEVIEKGSIALVETMYDPNIGYDTTRFHSKVECIVEYFNVTQPNGEAINRILSQIPEFDYSLLPIHISSMIKHRKRSQ